MEGLVGAKAERQEGEKSNPSRCMDDGERAVLQK